MRIDPSVLEGMSLQDYNPKPKIIDVTLRQGPYFSDEGGSFSELARLDDSGVMALEEMQVRQVSYSYILPNSIKAYHLHLNQDDIWFVPPTDRLLVNLIDVREGSGTYMSSMRFVLGAGKLQFLRIPKGVAHGCANLTLNPVSLIYFTSNQFNIEKPDEFRLPWDYFGSDKWVMKYE